jgi:hypothetical protein
MMYAWGQFLDHDLGFESNGWRQSHRYSHSDRRSGIP